MIKMLLIGSSSQRFKRHFPLNEGRGFSLVELLVVLTIISILVSSISYVMLKKDDSLKTITNNIVHNLHIVQQQSIRNSREYQIEIDLAENSLTFLDESIELPGYVSVTVRTAENQIVDNEVVGMTFYPDASSSGGVIILESETELFEISVIWISGKIVTRYENKAT
jgi:prepilin-type N-terminal cleavage/methylation domain-containing protein